MTPTEQFAAREARQHAMQSRIDAGNEDHSRFHEPSDGEIDRVLRRRVEDMREQVGVLLKRIKELEALL